MGGGEGRLGRACQEPCSVQHGDSFVHDGEVGVADIAADIAAE